MSGCKLGKTFDSDRFEKDLSDCDRMMGESALGGSVCFIGMMEKDYCKDKETGVSSGEDRYRSEYPVGRDNNDRVNSSDEKIFKKHSGRKLMNYKDYDEFLRN